MIGFSYDAPLNTIRDSDITFYRNGRKYSSNEAYRWLSWKAQHKQYTKSPIDGSCDFINRVATRSNSSGELYFVEDKTGKVEQLNKWLKKQMSLSCK